MFDPSLLSESCHCSGGAAKPCMLCKGTRMPAPNFFRSFLISCKLDPGPCLVSLSSEWIFLLSGIPLVMPLQTCLEVKLLGNSKSSDVYNVY